MSTTIEVRLLDARIQELLQTVQTGDRNDPSNPAATVPALVGLGRMPLDSGWGSSEPNGPDSVFVPYFVITTLTATPAADSGSFATPQGDWHIPYAIQSFGVTHDQARQMADKGRTALAPLKGEILQLGASKYKVQQVWTSQIGGVNRVPYSEPPFYGQQDGATVWLAKRRTP